MATGLSLRLDQFEVSHTSQRGYLPFSEVQRGDKRKKSSHLIKGKRKKAMGTKPMKWVEGHHSVALASDSLIHSCLHSFIHHHADSVPEALREAQWRKTEMNMNQDTVPASTLLAWRIPRTEEPGELQSMGS